MSLPPLHQRLELARYLHRNPSAHVTLMTGAGPAPSHDTPPDAASDASPLAGLPSDAPRHADRAAFEPSPLPLSTSPIPTVATVADVAAPLMVTTPARADHPDDPAPQRRDDARQRNLQTKLRFHPWAQRVDRKSRDAADQGISAADSMRDHLAARAARRARLDDRPIPLKADGSIDVAQAKRDRYDQIAFEFRIPGTAIHPFRIRGEDGKARGDRHAYAAYQERERAKRVTDEQGQPRFIDPATGELDMKGYRKMLKLRAAQARR